MGLQRLAESSVSGNPCDCRPQVVMRNVSRLSAHPSHVLRLYAVGARSRGKVSHGVDGGADMQGSEGRHIAASRHGRSWLRIIIEKPLHAMQSLKQRSTESSCGLVQVCKGLKEGASQLPDIDGSWLRIIIEKPFGMDLESSEDLAEDLNRCEPRRYD